MSTPLRMLMVEDSPDNVLLLVRELRRGGFEPIYERVETAEDLRWALESGTWDLVISDYNMPRFRATEALQLPSGYQGNRTWTLRSWSSPVLSARRSP